jgi:hypothetical protein
MTTFRFNRHGRREVTSMKDHIFESGEGGGQEGGGESSGGEGGGEGEGSGGDES